MVVELINCKVLKLVCVDEVHLFVMFGVTFRKEFTLLKSAFFRHLMADTVVSDAFPDSLASYLKVPLLLMTATMNGDLLTMLQNMIGIRVHAHSYLWRNWLNMGRRNI